MDPYSCYTIPSGFVGVINDLASIYIITCLVGGRTPLRPKRRLSNRDRTTLFCFICFGQVEISNIIFLNGCLKQSGYAKELIWMMLLKIVFLPVVFVFVTGIAIQHIATNSHVVSRGGLEDGNLGDAYGMLEKANSRIDLLAEIQDHDSTLKAATTELPNGAADVRNTETAHSEPSLMLNNSTIYFPASDKTTSSLRSMRSSPDLEIQLDTNERPQSGEAREPLLPEVENLTSKHRQIRVLLGRIAIFCVMLVPITFLTAHISMAIKSDNINTQVVGFIFFILLLAGITPLLFGAHMIGRPGWRTAPQPSAKFRMVPVRGALVVPFIYFSLLVILYGDVNLGVVNGRLLGLGPTENKAGLALYWIYLLSTKISLLCY